MKLLIIAIMALISFSLNTIEFDLFDTVNMQPVGFSQMIEDLLEVDVIFIGEFHGNSYIHKFQHFFIEEFFKNNQNLAISMEMFERDTQDILNLYLAGEVKEEKFLSDSRPWSNYESDYRPVIEFAKKNDLPVIASNIPRRIAASVGREGIQTLKNLNPEDRAYVARNIVLLEDEYKERFFDVMSQTPMHQTGSDKSRLNNMYAAQSIKDDTMAESIYIFKENNPRMTVIHLNGDFHSNSFLGTVSKLQLLNPTLSIAVITPIVKNLENENIKDLSQKYLYTGTYLFFVDID